MVSLKYSVALTLAVVGHAAAAFTSCGDLNWACCDIPENDPNGGTCRDDTLMACWEGYCKRCGTDGMPACAGPKPCTGKNIIQVGTFCTFDNSKAPEPHPQPAPEPTPKPAPKPTKPPRKRAGKPKGPRKSRRTRMRNPKAPRGTVKPKPAPTEKPPPAPEPVAPVKKEEKEPALRCGDLKWECCDIPDNDPNGGTCRDDTLMTCWEGVCKRCGTDGMPICAGPKPCTGKLAVHKGFCTFDNGMLDAA